VSNLTSEHLKLFDPESQLFSFTRKSFASHILVKASQLKSRSLIYQFSPPAETPTPALLH